jgi:glycerol-3-phosphate dehydrogenase
MAWTLADVVMRRTGMGTQGCPPAAHLEAVSRLMAEELGWDEARRASELADLGRAYAPVAVATGADAGPARIGAARG